MPTITGTPATERMQVTEKQQGCQHKQKCQYKYVRYSIKKYANSSSHIGKHSGDIKRRVANSSRNLDKRKVDSKIRDTNSSRNISNSRVDSSRKCILWPRKCTTFVKIR